MNASILKEYGVDYQKGLARCLGDERFYEMLLTLFLEDDTFARAGVALEKGDYKELFNCMHELKGVCGNADLTALYQAVCPLVETLRAGNADPDRVKEQFAQAEDAFHSVREGVRLALGQEA